MGCSNKDNGSTPWDAITSPTANLAKEDIHHNYHQFTVGRMFVRRVDTCKCPYDEIVDECRRFVLWRALLLWRLLGLNSIFGVCCHCHTRQRSSNTRRFVNFFGDIPILPRDYTGIFLLWRVKSGGNFWWEKRGKRRHRGNAF
jgi:hypothetical protein